MYQNSQNKIFCFGIWNKKCILLLKIVKTSTIISIIIIQVDTTSEDMQVINLNVKNGFTVYILNYTVWA